MSDELQKEPQSRPSLVPIVVGLLVVAIGVVIFLAVGGTKPKEQPKEEVEVPDLIYCDRAEAEKTLSDVGLKLGEVSDEDTQDMPEGHVLRQDPEAKKKLEKGGAVNIVLSKGLTTATVPDVRGMTSDQAEQVLTNAWIVPVQGAPVYSDDVDPGKVCVQSVDPGTQVDVLSQVTYATSLGKETVGVPDVTGKDVDDARDVLQDAGLGCDVTKSYDDNVPVDVVISQSVAKDTKVEKGTVVTVNVSLGKKPADKVKVPNILTYSEEDAIRVLESAGLRWQRLGDDGGRVIDVDPKIGTEVDQGSTVTFTLRTTDPQPQPDPQPEPDPEPKQYITEDEAKSIALDAEGVDEADVTGFSYEIDTSGDSPIYKVRFESKDGGSVYLVQLDAYNGSVLSAV